MLDFLGSTRAGRTSAGRTPSEERRGEDLGDEGEEGGPGPLEL